MKFIIELTMLGDKVKSDKQKKCNIYSLGVCHGIIQYAC